MSDDFKALDPIDELIAEHAPIHDVDPGRRRRLAAAARHALVSPPPRLVAWTWLAARYRWAEPGLVAAISALYLAWCASVVWRYLS